MDITERVYSAEQLFVAREFEKASSLLAGILKAQLAGCDPRQLIKIAQLAVELGNGIEAEAVISSVLDQSNGAAERYFVLGVLAALQNRFTDAEDLYLRAIKSSGPSTETLLPLFAERQLAYVFVNQGKYGKAESVLRKSYEKFRKANQTEEARIVKEMISTLYGRQGKSTET